MGPFASKPNDAIMTVKRIAASLAFIPTRIANAGRDEADSSYISPEYLSRWQPFWNQRRSQIHINKMRSTPYQTTNPKRDPAQPGEARDQFSVDLGAVGIEKQSARGDRQLHGDAFVSTIHGVPADQQAAVHQQEDKESVIAGQRRSAPHGGSAPFDGRRRDNHERTRRISQGGSHGKVFGYRLPRVEISEYQAG